LLLYYGVQGARSAWRVKDLESLPRLRAFREYWLGLRRET
jgi:hypothetical protein